MTFSAVVTCIFLCVRTQACCCFHNCPDERLLLVVGGGVVFVREWKVRVGWPCYQLVWVGQAGRRLLSVGRDRQLLALLPGQNISPGAAAHNLARAAVTLIITGGAAPDRPTSPLPITSFSLPPHAPSPLWPPTPRKQTNCAHKKRWCNAGRKRCVCCKHRRMRSCVRKRRVL